MYSSCYCNLPFTLQETSDFHSDMQITLQLAWHDERLRWDSEKWHFTKYPVTLTPMQQIWAPHFRLKGVEYSDS